MLIILFYENLGFAVIYIIIIIISKITKKIVNKYICTD